MGNFIPSRSQEIERPPGKRGVPIRKKKKNQNVGGEGYWAFKVTFGEVPEGGQDSSLGGRSLKRAEKGLCYEGGIEEFSNPKNADPGIP